MTRFDDVDAETVSRLADLRRSGVIDIAELNRFESSLIAVKLAVLSSERFRSNYLIRNDSTIEVTAPMNY